MTILSCFRVNIKADPLVKATVPPIQCGKCGKHGHTKRSCKVGLAATDDDVMVNNILIMTLSPPVPIGAGGDHNEEEAMSGAEPDEDEEGGGEDDAANEEEEEDDLDDIATFNDIFDVVMKQQYQQVNSDYQSSENEDEGDDVE